MKYLSNPEEEQLDTTMRNEMEMTPPAIQEPSIPDNIPQEQVFTTPKLEDILSKREMSNIEAQDQDIAPLLAEATPAKPLSRQEQLLQEYMALSGKGSDELKKARETDRMLKMGGAIGDALATLINARSQSKAKIPGVQVQQGAGLGKVADLFQTAPEISSDLAARREALMNQYKQLALGERSKARLESEEKRAKESMDLRKELSEKEIDARLKEAKIKASEKGKITPYQEMLQDVKKSEALDRKTQKLASDLKTSQDVATTVEGIEQELGFNLDNIDKEGKLEGKSIDIPGISIPGIGRVTAYSDKARVLDDTMSKLFNVELKNRSGVAVTPPELKNLKREFSEGKFNTEEEKLKAMKRFKEGLKKAFTNIEAGYSKDVISEYQDRGGFTSERFGGTSEKAAKKAVAGDIVTVKGKKYKVAEDGDSLIPVGQ